MSGTEWWIRAVALALWLALVFKLAPSAWAVLMGKARPNDQSRADNFFVGLLVSGFQIRWFFARSLDGLYLTMLAMSALLAAWLLFKSWAMGRGTDG